MSLFSDFMSMFSGATGGSWQAPTEQRQQQIQQQVAQATHTPYEPPRQTYTPSYSQSSYTPSYTTGYSGGYSSYGSGSYQPLPSGGSSSVQQRTYTEPASYGQTQHSLPEPQKQGGEKKQEKRQDVQMPTFGSTLALLGVNPEDVADDLARRSEGDMVENSLRPDVSTDGSGSKATDISANGLSRKEQEAIDKAQGEDNDMSRGLGDIGNAASTAFIGVLDNLLGTKQAGAAENEGAGNNGEISQEFKDAQKAAAEGVQTQANQNEEAAARQAVAQYLQGDNGNLMMNPLDMINFMSFNRGNDAVTTDDDVNVLRAIDPDNAAYYSALYSDGGYGLSEGQTPSDRAYEIQRNANAADDPLNYRAAVQQGQGEQGEQGEQEKELQEIYGKTLQDINRMSDMELAQLLYDNNESYRNYMNDQYADTFGNGDYGQAFTDFLFIEDPYDTEGKRDLARDIFGLNADAYDVSDAESQAILNYLNGMLYESGMERGLEGDDLVKGIVDTYFDPEQLIDISQWVGPGSYQSQNVITYDDVANALGRYIAEQPGGWSEMLENLEFPYDANDIGAWIMAGNLLNKDKGLLSDYTDYDLSRIQSLLNLAGDDIKLAFDGDKDDDKSWWNTTNNRYSAMDLNDILINGAGTFNPYDDRIMDIDMMDNIVGMVADATGKNISRSW